MAKFAAIIPNVIMREFEELYSNCPEIFEEVVKAGGQVVYDEILATAPGSFKLSRIMGCLKMTRAYRTLDGAVNVKIGFYGYFLNHLDKWTPAPLVANIFEYGSSKFKKRPFFRKAFRLTRITKVMADKAIELLERKIGG